MAKITFKGTPVNTSGNIPAQGSYAPDFLLVKSDLTNMKLTDLKGKKVVLDISPSLDTSICATAVRKFNLLAAGKTNVIILAITKDLPFAHNRFCTSEGITNVITLSGFKNRDFGKSYGVELIDGPFEGLYARCIIVIDEEGKVVYNQLVPEIATEPDYDAALAAL